MSKHNLTEMSNKNKVVLVILIFIVLFSLGAGLYFYITIPDRELKKKLIIGIQNQIEENGFEIVEKSECVDFYFPFFADCQDGELEFTTFSVNLPRLRGWLYEKGYKLKLSDNEMEKIKKGCIIIMKREGKVDFGNDFDKWEAWFRERVR